jgi:hypothetical protein
VFFPQGEITRETDEIIVLYILAFRAEGGKARDAELNLKRVTV